MHIAFDVLADAIKDTLYIIPFLFVTYLAMEWLEHKTGGKAEAAIQRAGAAGPFIGAVVGVVPQCGFSAAAATLWAGRVITLGTLFAVFLSTSDEMLPIFIAEQVPPDVIFKIIGAKIIIGMIMGFLVDAGLRIARRIDMPLHIHDLCEQEHCHCHDGEGGILRSALKHTLQVTLFIFLITLALNGLLAVVGEDVLAEFLGQYRHRAAVRGRRAGLGRHVGRFARVGGRGPAGVGSHEPPSEREYRHHRGAVRDGRHLGFAGERARHRVLGVRSNGLPC